MPLHTLGSLAAKLFGEGPKGLNENYKPLASLDLGIEAFWQYLPYDTYDTETGLFLNRDSTGFVLMGSPGAGATLSDQDKLDKFFSQSGNLPEGCSMQFLLLASPRIEDRLHMWKSYRVHPLYQELSQRRLEYLKTRAFDPRYPLREFKLLVSYTVPGVLTNPVEKENLVGVRKILQGSLEKIGLFLNPLDDKQLVREVGNIVNHEETTEQDGCWWSDHEELAKLIPAPDLAGRVSKDGFYLKNDTTLAHTFLPRLTSKVWALAHMDKLFGDILDGSETIPCPFLLHYGFTVLQNQGFQKKKALSKRETLENGLKTRMSKWQPNLEEEYEEAREIVSELQKGERVVDASLSLTTFCRAKDFPRIQNTVESIWNAYGWSTKSATYGHLNFFLSSLPMMWTTGQKKKWTALGPRKQAIGAGTDLAALGFTRKTITKESQNLLPIVAEWTGQAAPGIPLQGRRGQLAFWTPFDGLFIPGQELYKTEGDYNFCITGVPGSGKSFLCNEIMTNTIAVGGKAFVLDKGGSFKNLCQALGGHHITFDFSKTFSLNPFTYIPEGHTEDEIQDRTSLLQGLMSIVTQMAFPSGQKDDAHLGFLKEAIYTVWDAKKSCGTIDAIRDHLTSVEDARAKDIARSLIDFTSAGAYGRFFNPPANIDLSNDFIVVETDNLEEPLKSVMIMMVMVQVWQRMIFSDRKTPFLILIDEAWDLLRAEATGKFIEALALTSRKYRGSLGVATQSLHHFFKDGAMGPRAAWENSAWKVIFTQAGDTLSGLKEHPQLGEFVKEGYRETLLRSLQSARGFSEFVLFHAKVSGVPLRLFCDPFTTLLYSTNAQEVATLNDLQKQGLTLNQAIERLLAQRGMA